MFEYQYLTRNKAHLFAFYEEEPKKDEECTSTNCYWGQVNSKKQPHGWGVSFFTMEMHGTKTKSYDLYHTGMWENGIIKSYGPDVLNVPIELETLLNSRRQTSLHP
jgi:hypothetical protein